MVGTRHAKDGDEPDHGGVSLHTHPHSSIAVAHAAMLRGRASLFRWLAGARGRRQREDPEHTLADPLSWRFLHQPGQPLESQGVLT